MNQTVLYVIIVTYYAHKWVDKFMDSINQSTIKPKVIIVDNASEDDTVAIIKEKYPEVDLIENSTNIGFGAANNIGIKKALQQGADYVFLLNQDAWVEPNCFECLISTASNNHEYGILSPIQLTPHKEKTIEDHFSLFITRDGDKQEIVSDFFFNNKKNIYNVKFIQAAGWMLTKECLNDVGDFDPLFYHYGEDSDYANRVIRHNFKIGIITKALMYHAAEHYSPKIITKKYIYNKELNTMYSWWIRIYKNYEGRFIIGLLELVLDFNNMIIKDLIHLNFKGVKLKTHLFLKLLLKTKQVLKSKKNYW